MVPGYVQGVSRVPPDHRESGGVGGMNSECLWWAPKLEPRTSNFEP